MADYNQKEITQSLSNIFGLYPDAHGEETISHYCDLPALLSILTHGNLWASNIRFLNDREEMDFGVGIATEVVEEMGEITGTDLSVPSRVFFDPALLVDVYAVSFCEHPDILSMWRGYGSGRQSVSIQFHRGTMENLAYLSNFELQKVVYGRQGAIDALRENIGAARELVETIIRDSSLVSSFNSQWIVSRVAPRLKNEHFSEEQEWRLISTKRPEKVLYRVRDNVFLPYVSIESAPHALPIESITIGPGKESDLTRRSVEHFLANSPNYYEVEVIQSTIPYRT